MFVLTLSFSFAKASNTFEVMSVSKSYKAKKKPYYSIQIASSKDQIIAEDLVKELEKESHTMFIYPAVVKGHLRFRVWVGVFSSFEEAKLYKKNHFDKIQDSFILKVGK